MSNRKHWLAMAEIKWKRFDKWSPAVRMIYQSRTRRECEASYGGRYSTTSSHAYTRLKYHIMSGPHVTR